MLGDRSAIHSKALRFVKLCKQTNECLVFEAWRIHEYSLL